MLVALVLLASVPGYCYTDTVAQKTTDDVPDYQSSIQVGLSPGEEAAIAGGTIVGSGLLAGGATYFVLAGRFQCLQAFSRTISGALVYGFTLTFDDCYKWIPDSGWRIGDAVGIVCAVPVAIIVIVLTATGGCFWWSLS
jgi:hypothetical protein